MRGRHLAAALAAVLVAAAPAASSAMAALDQFAATAPMSVARSNPAAVALADGRVLVTGGRGTGGVALASAEVFDPATHTWSATAAMSTARADTNAVRLPDGRVLVAGGVDAVGQGLATAEAWSPQTGQWSAVASLPITGAAGQSALMDDGTVLFQANGTDSALYDPATDSWSNVSGPDGPFTGQSRLAALDDGYALVLGLQGGMNGVDTYSPYFGWSTAMPAVPSAEESTVTAMSGGRALVAGGLNGGVPAPDAQVFHGYSFSAVGAMATPRADGAAAALPDGRVLVAGGRTGAVAPARTATAEVYDPGTEAFTSTGSMTLAREGMPAVTMANGEVLVPGGTDAAGAATAATDIYTYAESRASITPAAGAAFGSRTVATGPSAATTFTITSIGDAPLVLGNLTTAITGTGAAQFAITGGTCASGASVPVGSWCSVQVAFGPTAAGTASAALEVPADTVVPSVPLSGTGVAASATPAGTPTPPSNWFATSWITPQGNAISSRVRVPGPGVIRQVATVVGSSGMARQAQHAVPRACATSRTATKAATYALACDLSQSLRPARFRRVVQVRLSVTFTPTGGTPRTVAYVVRLPRLGTSTTRAVGAVAG